MQNPMNTKTKFAALGLFDAKVPRYTSYPTAPHFGADVGPENFRNWLKAIPAGKDISLYLHIPFCRRLCWFCACRTQGTATAKPLVSYLETLKQEIDLVADALPAGTKLARMHWGGGTPTLLDPEMISGLAAYIAERLPLANGAEFSVEIDPNEIDQTRMDALAAAGMSRASIGVQDFDDAIQKTIGRIQSFATTADAVGMARAAGIQSLNADILYGLPFQTRARITTTVQKLLSLGPDRVALYGYAHVPWMARRQAMIPSEALPKPEERLDLFETARRLFVWDGYREIGIDHFARPEDGLSRALDAGTLRRNFQGYTDDAHDVLVGLGASAISRFPQGYAQNQSGTADYTRAVREGRFPTARGHAFRGEDDLRGRIIEKAMCEFAVRYADFPEDVDRLRTLLRAANERFPDLLDLNAEGLFIPPESRALTRLVARAFDAYEMDAQGHSHAI